MPQIHHALTPDALAMIDTIARTGSFAAAARELGKVPSALTYSVRQLEEALDVLLFDRRSRQAKFTAAGEELLNEGRRLLAETAAVAHRVKRVASGWETQLSVAVDDVISRITVFELCEAFYALDPQGTHRQRHARQRRPGHAAEAAHRGAGRHLGSAGQRPGRPGHRRGHAQPAAGRGDGAVGRDGLRLRGVATASAGRGQGARSTTSSCCATAPWRWPTPPSTCRR